jgi:hypothetical protein
MAFSVFASLGLATLAAFGITADLPSSPPPVKVNRDFVLAWHNPQYDFALLPLSLPSIDQIDGRLLRHGIRFTLKTKTLSRLSVLPTPALPLYSVSQVDRHLVHASRRK